MPITVKIMATDSPVTALSVAISVTLMCTSLSQHCCYNCCHNAVLGFATTALSQQCQVAFVVTLMCTLLSQHCPLPLLSQRCHCQFCNITISTIAVPTLCTFYHCGTPPVCVNTGYTNEYMRGHGRNKHPTTPYFGWGAPL